jgi:hypothetical protein
MPWGDVKIERERGKILNARVDYLYSMFIVLRSSWIAWLLFVLKVKKESVLQLTWDWRQSKENSPYLDHSLNLDVVDSNAVAVAVIVVLVVVVVVGGDVVVAVESVEELADDVVVVVAVVAPAFLASYSRHSITTWDQFGLEALDVASSISNHIQKKVRKG